MNWISVNEQMPERLQNVYIIVQNNGKQFQSIAQYVPPKSVLFEDYINNDYTNDVGDYDETIDDYWSPSGFYEHQTATDINFMITKYDGIVTHWMPLFENPKIGQ